MQLRKQTQRLHVIFCLLLSALMLSPLSLFSTPVDGPQASQPTSTIIYVNDDAGGDNNGSSWTNAYNSLQDALIAAHSGDQIWVATGTYRPSAHPAGCSNCATNRDYTFLLPDGVAVYGGFAGTENPATFNLTDRDFSAHETILSGDIGTLNDDSDNVYHVVLSVNATTRLDGFTVTGGNADGSGAITINGQDALRSRGGGIYTSAGSNTLINNTVANNFADSRGGGISTFGGTNTLTNNTVSSNEVGFNGGGISNDGGYNTLNHNTVTGNEANDGGGIYTHEGYNTLSNNIVADNSASYGGGIHVEEGTDTLNNNTVTGNEASREGGGIYTEEGSNVLSNNLVTGNSASRDGGGVYTRDSNNALTNNTVAENTANEEGGGIYTWYGNNTLTDNRVTGNSAAREGGGIYTDFSTNTLTNNTVTGNSASTNGGGIFTRYGSNALINNTVSENTANEQGGGIFTDNGTNTLTNNTVAGNEADDDGGGIYTDRSTNTLTNNTVAGNSAGEGGGGIYTLIGNNILTNNTVTGNEADRGGGVFISDGTIMLTNNTVTGNSADDDGGGIFTIESNNTLVNNTVTGNSADDDGGGIYTEGSNSTLVNNTVSGNMASASGGGIYIDFGINSLTNNIIWGNNSGLEFEAITLTVNHNIIQGGYSGGTNNLDDDPLFVNPLAPGLNTEGDYRLLPCSPAIDAGTDTGAPTEDILGNLRPIDGNGDATATTDMGAYEYQSTGGYDNHIYVDIDATAGNNNGTSWADAFLNLQDALQAAVSCGVDNIWVAAGTYYPSAYPAGCDDCASDRDFTFLLPDGVAVYGGFAGTEDPANFDLANRDFTAHETILSGDIDQDGTFSGNAHHVVLAVDATTRLDGFTVTRGRANGSGAITVDGEDIRRSNGGGIYSFFGTNILVNNIVSGNSAGNAGGGVYNFFGTNTLSNSTVSGNSASNFGGGVYTWNGSNTLSSNTVAGNTANNGGGIFTTFGNHTLTNNTVTGNSGSFGGGIHTSESVNRLTNNTVAGNSASNGGGMYIFRSNNTLTNNIIWGNNSGLFVLSSTLPGLSSTLTVNHNIIQGGFTGGNNNLDADPLFVTPQSPGQNTGGDYRLLPCSPAIDAGTATGAPANDLDGNPRPANAGIDLGAYEFQGTPTPVIATCQNQTVVLNTVGNGNLNAVDLDNGSTGCGTLSFTVDNAGTLDFDCMDVGPNSVTLTVTDNRGLSSTCTATVIVQDNTAPTAVCLNTTVELQPDGLYHLQQSDVYDAANSSDNCPYLPALGGPVPGAIDNVSFPSTTFGCDDVGLIFPVTVTVTDPSGNSDNCTANVSVIPGTALPSGWAASDIGDQGAGSDYAYAPCARKNPNRGDFTVSTGAYNLIPSNSDNLAFIGRELCNNGGIQARIEDVSGGYAGLMIRESNAPGAKMVAVYSNLTSLLRREIRTTDNGPRASNTSFAPFHYWLRLVRQNDYIRAFYRTSDNGSWTLFHQAYLPMQPCVEMGLAVFTTDPNGQAQATFSRVQWQSNAGGNSLALFNEGAAAAQPEEREASVFPNPARDAFTLAFSKAPESGGIAILRNQVGQVVGQRQLQPGEVATEWDVSSLPSGLYLMEVRQEGWPFQVIRMIKTN
ncbi:right-handed parallel beta-helix repeat-containing protein [Phaeodactylibacter xiamenensis]|uniref:right-handed parallel beta-helix repeat-containing protein n=1 Tax=Phaeodactylibacter xiamenensis TaxID=1524460 RepID=UPI003CCB83BB